MLKAISLAIILSVVGAVCGPALAGSLITDQKKNSIMVDPCKKDKKKNGCDTQF